MQLLLINHAIIQDVQYVWYYFQRISIFVLNIKKIA